MRAATRWSSPGARGPAATLTDMPLTVAKRPAASTETAKYLVLRRPASFQRRQNLGIAKSGTRLLAVKEPTGAALRQKLVSDEGNNHATIFEKD